MFIHVLDSKYIDGYRVWLKFSDQVCGEIDLRPHLVGKIFEPLHNQEYFKTFALEGHTLTWQNGADFAPEFLRSQIKREVVAG